MAIVLPTAKDILLDYPGQFSGESPARIQRFLDKAAAYLDEGDWDPKDYPLAVTYWALHQLTLFSIEVADNPIASLGLDVATIKSIDVADEFKIDLQSSKDVGIGAEGGLSATKWGRLFLELESRRKYRVAFGRDPEADRLSQSAKCFGRSNDGFGYR